MVVKKNYYCLGEDRMFIAMITGSIPQNSSGESENGDASWTLEIASETFDGTINHLFDADYKGLYQAEQAMKKWRKGMKWNQMKG